MKKTEPIQEDKREGGVLLYGGRDEVIEARALKAQLPVIIFEGWDVPFEKTLLVKAGTRVPWDLLRAAWQILERWDVAVPLWRYTAAAEDVGTSEDRELTRGVVRDLRVLLYACEMLFVRKNEAGEKLVEAWRNESSGPGDSRLAFLRAFYRVKPRLCVLPATWMIEQRVANGVRSGPAQQRGGEKQKAMVRVELAPGQFVKCFAGDEEKVKALMGGRGR